MPPPQVVICEICQGKFSKHSLAIHQKACVVKRELSTDFCPVCDRLVDNSEFGSHVAECKRVNGAAAHEQKLLKEKAAAAAKKAGGKPPKGGQTTGNATDLSMTNGLNGAGNPAATAPEKKTRSKIPESVLRRLEMAKMTGASGKPLTPEEILLKDLGQACLSCGSSMADTACLGCHAVYCNPCSVMLHDSNKSLSPENGHKPIHNPEAAQLQATEQFSADTREVCNVCTRKFDSSKIARHQLICQKSSMKAPRKGFKSALEDRLKGTDFEKYNRPLLANAAAAAKAAAKAAATNAGKPGSAGSVMSTGTLGTTASTATNAKGAAAAAAAKVEPSAAAAAASAAAYAAILPPGKPLPKNATIAKALIQKATKAAAAAAAAADIIEKEKATGGKWREEHEAFLQIASAGKTTATTPTKPPHAAAAAAAMTRAAASTAASAANSAPPSSASSPESVVSLQSVASVAAHSVAASDPGSVDASDSATPAPAAAAAPAPKLKPLQVGDKVILLDKNGLTGILQFKGPIWGLKKGTWFGVEFHDGPHGRNDGSYNGTHYFYCKENHGLFVRPERVEAVVKQYIVAAPPPSSAPIEDAVPAPETVKSSVTSTLSSPTKPQSSLLTQLKAKVASPKQTDMNSSTGGLSSQPEEPIVRKSATARTPPKVAVAAPAPAAPSPPKAAVAAPAPAAPSPPKAAVAAPAPAAPSPPKAALSPAKDDPRPVSAASIKSAVSATSAAAKKPSAPAVTASTTGGVAGGGGGAFNKSLVNNLRKKVDAARPSTNLVEQVKAKQAAAAAAGPLHAPVATSATAEPGFEEARRRDIARNADFLRVLAGEKTKLAAADETALPFSGSGQKLGGSTAGTDPTDTGRGGPKRKVVNAMGQLTYAKGVTDSLPEREKRAAAALARINAMQKQAAAQEASGSSGSGGPSGSIPAAVL